MKLPRTLTFILAFAAIPVCGQTKYTAGKIVFNHSGPYTQAQLEQAAGMHTGVSFTADDLGAAAQRLIDTGFFTNAGATLEGRVNSASVLFDITPIENAQMLHVRFENFVWLSPAEIESALQAKAQLFGGYLPESSPLQDVFKDALTQMLAAKGVAAMVTYETVEPTMLRPERAIEFRIASPVIRVANVKLQDVSPELAPLIQKSVNSVAKTLYSETTEDAILALLLDAGYVQASLSSVEVVPTLSGDAASVVLSATLSLGDVYRVSGIAFAGSPMLSADAFAASAKLHPGDIASRAALLETLAPLDAAYRRLGYMDVTVKATPTVDAATHQVAYTVSVVPGERIACTRLRRTTLTTRPAPTSTAAS
jgi:outer membrane protein insertion porin family